MRPILAQLGDAIPVLETERLILRAPRLEDFEVVAAYFASDRSRFVGGPVARDEVWQGFSAHAGQWLLRGYGQWMAQDRAGRLIGRAGIWHPDDWAGPELTWTLFDAADEGHGLASEMAQAALAGAAQLGVTRPISSIKSDNPRSIRLAERLGAVNEGERDTCFGPMLTFRHGVAA